MPDKNKKQTENSDISIAGLNSKPVEEKKPAEVKQPDEKKPKEKKSVFSIKPKKASSVFGASIEKPKEKVIKGETKKRHLFSFVAREQKSLALSIAKNLLFIILAGGFFIWSIYFDLFSDFTQQALASDLNAYVVTNNAAEQLVLGDKIQTNTSNDTIIILSEDSLLRLDQNTVLTIQKDENDEYSVILEQGKIWVNTLYDQIPLKIITSNAVILPENTAMNIETDDSITTLYADKHNALVSLFVDGQSDNFLNQFWLVEGHQVIISHKKINDKASTIQQLLYAKLLKEFGNGRLSENKKQEDPWISKQMQLDKQYEENITIAHIAALREEGLNTVTTDSIRSVAKEFIDDFQETLTFSEPKKINLFANYIFENLHDAEYLYIQGKTLDADLRMTLFKEDITNSPYNTNELFKEVVFDKLHNELSEVLFVVPGDELYPVKKSLIDQLQGPFARGKLSSEDQFMLLTYYMHDVYATIEENPADALGTLGDYFSTYAALLRTKQNNLPLIKGEILKQNLLVDNLFLLFPDVYSVEFLNKKKSMENDYLASLESSLEKQEQRQTLISNKINLLGKIRLFLFNDDLSPETARSIVFLVIQDIEDLQKDTLSAAAVNKLFDSQLADFGVFWEYLNTPEYSTTPLHGASHRERYDAFKEVQQEQLSFQDIREEILSTITDEEPLTVDEILEQAEEDLNNADIQKVEFGFYNDPNQTKITLTSASTGGIGFTANYDWDRQILSNILVNDQVISKQGVKLSNAKKFILETISAQTRVDSNVNTGSTSTQETDDPQAKIKSAAKVFLIEKFGRTGMTITRENIVIEDLDAGVYKVNDVFYTENKQGLFSFRYTTRDDQISDLIIQTEDGLKNVDNRFNSVFLKNVVNKIYEESVPQE